MPDRTVPRERPHVRGCGAVTQVSSYRLADRPDPHTGRSATATSPSLWAEFREESHHRLPHPPARPAHSAHAHWLHTLPPEPLGALLDPVAQDGLSGRRAHAFG